MTDRSLFNRRYTSYTPNGTEVWLLNGSSVSTTLSSTQNLLASEDLAQGDVVFISGAWAVPATAASGASYVEYNAVGLTATSASTNATVGVILDDTATVSSANIVGDSSLVPGDTYYLSKYKGKLTRFATSSGTVVAASGYGALVVLGTAVSPSELQVEIAAPIILVP